ncbi:MAG: hypothetical protein IKK70_06680 [Clostridia bacterium]|nr:hypothetical protein [Clostridia bacterium]
MKKLTTIKLEMFFKKHKLLVILVSAVLVIALVFATLVFSYKYMREHAFDKNRPTEGTITPELSGEITDIDVKFVERECRLDELTFNGRTALQTMYGYCVDGTWTYIPCENYELYGILDDEGDKGFEVAEKSHIVKIGEHLLVAVRVPNYSFDMRVEISEDSSDTRIFAIEQFAGRDVGEYVYLKEKGTLVGTKEYDFSSMRPFPDKRYAVVKQSDITEDFRLCMKIFKIENGEEQFVKDYVLTYGDIQRVLGS